MDLKQDAAAIQSEAVLGGKDLPGCSQEGFFEAAENIVFFKELEKTAKDFLGSGEDPLERLLPEGQVQYLPCLSKLNQSRMKEYRHSILCGPL